MWETLMKGDGTLICSNFPRSLVQWNTLFIEENQKHRCYPVPSQTTLYSCLIDLSLEYWTTLSWPYTDRHCILIQTAMSVFCCTPDANKDDLYNAGKWLIIHKAQLHPSIPSCKDCFGDFKGGLEAQRILCSLLVVSSPDFSRLHNILLCGSIYGHTGDWALGICSRSMTSTEITSFKKVLFRLCITYSCLETLERHNIIEHKSNKPHSICLNKVSNFLPLIAKILGNNSHYFQKLIFF